MRLADIVLRRGHLSEDALVETWNTGVRPVHLDRCDLCAARVTEVSRWLEDVHDIGHADADVAFPEERLAAQRTQVLQRLADLDRPAKVISFPARSTRPIDLGAGRGVSPGWLAAAAAAGLMLGVVSVEMRHTFWPDTPAAVSSASAPVTALVSAPTLDASPLFDDPYSQPELGELDAMAEMTPRLIDMVVIYR